MQDIYIYHRMTPIDMLYSLQVWSPVVDGIPPGRTQDRCCQGCSTGQPISNPKIPTAYWSNLVKQLNNVISTGGATMACTGMPHAGSSPCLRVVSWLCLGSISCCHKKHIISYHRGANIGISNSMCRWQWSVFSTLIPAPLLINFRPGPSLNTTVGRC